MNEIEKVNSVRTGLSFKLQSVSRSCLTSITLKQHLEGLKTSMFRQYLTKKKRLSIVIHMFFVFMMFMSVKAIAGNVEFISIERLLVNKQVKEIQLYSVNLLSNKRLFKPKVSRLNKLKSDLVHINKIKINGADFYRLVAGNFKNKSAALKQLIKFKKIYKGAWLGKRSKTEKQALAQLVSKVTTKAKRKFKRKVSSIKPSRQKKLTGQSSIAKRIFSKMKQYLIDQNYPRLVASANKVIEIGNNQQKQQAMELLGVARERQGKFAQAIAVYNEFLQTYPKSPLKDKILNRLESLKTMRLEPKTRQAKRKRNKRQEEWNVFGSASQYYRDDVIKQGSEAADNVNSSLLSDLNLFARKRTEKDVTVIRFDGGMVNDFLDNTNEGRISRAMVSYSDKVNQYKIIGGRQSRTAKGALGRFDGVVYTDLSRDNYKYSVYSGFPVQSSADGIQTENYFIGGSINFEPYPKLMTDIYLVSQYNSSLVDRQAIGSELQYITDKGFLFGIIDYDFFYSELNNITTIGNYRYDDQWSFNMTIDFRNSPLLTTVNALQGQNVDTLSELSDLFSDDQIYTFAQDRTSKSQNIYFGANYIIDTTRQFNGSISLSNTGSTNASGSVLATPASDSIYLSGDYGVQNFFNLKDFSTIGLRLSQATNSETISLRTRTRFKDTLGIRYSPRINLDFRLNTDSGLRQTILKPSLKATYKHNKKFSFEASLAFEFSDFNLPDQDKQTAYSIYMGYIYQF